MILVDWSAIRCIEPARGLFRYVMPHVSFIQSLILVFPCPKAVVCLNVRRLVKIREGLCGGIATRARPDAKTSPGLFAAGLQAQRKFLILYRLSCGSQPCHICGSRALNEPMPRLPIRRAWPPSRDSIRPGAPDGCLQHGRFESGRPVFARHKSEPCLGRRGALQDSQHALPLPGTPSFCRRRGLFGEAS
jgi:hypothetical protein